MSPSAYYFTANSYNMLRIALCLCVLRAAAIIVTDAPPSTDYNYWYDIAHPTTGDAKLHKEIRQGAFIRGSYSLIDPARKRTVDTRNGFKAIIRTVVHSPYISLKSYSPFNSANRVPRPEFHQAPATNKNLIQHEPVLFTPGNNTQIDRPTFNKGELFLPNYMHH